MSPAEISKWLTATIPGMHMSPPAQAHPEPLPAPIQCTLSAKPHLHMMSGPIRATLNLSASLQMRPAAADCAEHARQTNHTGQAECVRQADRTKQSGKSIPAVVTHAAIPSMPHWLANFLVACTSAAPAPHHGKAPNLVSTALPNPTYL